MEIGKAATKIYTALGILYIILAPQVSHSSFVRSVISPEKRRTERDATEYPASYTVCSLRGSTNDDEWNEPSREALTNEPISLL